MSRSAISRSRSPRRAGRGLGISLALGLLVAAPATALMGPPQAAPPEGDPANPITQYRADRADPLACSTNSLLVFRVRGSGEGYGSDRLAAWSEAVVRTAVDHGWRVRELQGIYPAPGAPSRLQVALHPGAVRAYVRASERAGPVIRRAIVHAYARCPSRPMLVAGYSSGNIVLRLALPGLPARVRAMIRSVDLVADPAADPRTDREVQHPAGLHGRLGAKGAYTALVPSAGRPYPLAGGFRRRVAQFCNRADAVCNYHPPARTLLSALTARTHANYPFAAIGRWSGRSLADAPEPPAGPPLTADLTLAGGRPASVAITGVDLLDPATGQGRLDGGASLEAVLGAGVCRVNPGTSEAGPPFRERWWDAWGIGAILGSRVGDPLPADCGPGAQVIAVYATSPRLVVRVAAAGALAVSLQVGQELPASFTRRPVLSLRAGGESTFSAPDAPIPPCGAGAAGIANARGHLRVVGIVLPTTAACASP